ncbi:MAG: hypothetical protein RL607_1904 [Bacteroidota bacterium]
MFQNKRQFAIIGICLVLLLFIRATETTLFYDPLLVYFKGDFQNQPLPPFDSIIYLFNLMLRYFVNSVLSMGIIYALFNDRRLVRFVVQLYLGIGILLLIAFSIVVFNFKTSLHMELFYIRRFLIQPLLLLIFVPALYYQKSMKSPI